MPLTKDSEGNELKHVRKFADFAGKRILEIGCGEGRLTFKYAASAKQVIAFDTNHSALRVARADCPVDLHKQIHFAGASANHIPFSKETFDIAILAWSL